MATLELENLTKQYAGVVSVDSISLAVEHGEFVCLLGPSGCGKTTTLRMIAGFIEPDAGEIRVGGKVVSSPGRRCSARAAQHEHDLPELRGVAAHDGAAERRLRAEDEVDARGRARCSYRRAAGRRRSSVPKLIAIRRSSPAASSSASRWRARSRPSPISCCSTSRCPTSTPTCAARCASKSAACTMSFTTRRSTSRTTRVEAMTMADRIVIMNAGRIEQIGTPQEVYDRPNSKFVARFIGGSNVLDAKHVSGNRVEFAGHALDIGEGEFAGPGSR